MDTIRTFISLNIDEDTRLLLDKVQTEVKSLLNPYKVKWENPDKFHLTLRFLGNMNNTEVRELMRELGSLRFDFESIKFETNSIGFFPNARFPNVVFVDLTEEEQNCSKLVESIDALVKTLGIEPDKKFVPHITLGRFNRSQRQKIDEEIMVSVPHKEIIFDSFYLMKSSLKQFGSEYEEIMKYSFTNKE